MKRSQHSINRALLTNEKRLYVMEYLFSHPCIDCGNDNSATLDFDHIGDKLYNISDIVNSTKNVRVLEVEILKCEVRCANCHRIKTSKEQKSYRLQTLEELKQVREELQASKGPVCFVRHSILSDTLAQQIREKYSMKNYSYAELANIYGVKKSTIANLIQGKTWKEK